MSFVVLDPEVSGELGDQSILDTSTHPPVVERFHLDVTNWLGDDLVECFPCYAVTPRLETALGEAGLSGFQFAKMTTTANSDQGELNPDTTVPELRRLIVGGLSGRDDLGMDTDHRLVISARALAVFKRFSLQHCDMEPWKST